MRKITVVFTKSKKKLPLFSWLVRLWTWKPYSHVAVKFKTKKLPDVTYYQASDGLVNYMSEVQFNKKHEIIKTYELEVDSCHFRDILSACHHEAGANYGTLQNLGIVIVDIMKLLGKKINNPFKDGRNCSELLYVHILSKLGYENRDPDTIKPHHIEDLLTTRYKE